MKKLEAAYDVEAFRQQGHALIERLAAHLEAGQNRQSLAIPYADAAENLAFWENHFQNTTAHDPIDLLSMVMAQSTQLHHPRYMAHQVAVPLPLAALAGLVSNVLNNGMAVYEMGLVSVPLEKIVTDWLSRALGYDEQSTGFLTSGGTLASLTALLAARAAHLPTAWTGGHTEKWAVMVSEQAHYCIDRAAKVLGLGTEGVIKIPVDAAFKMDVSMLEPAWQQAQAKGLRVVAVVGSACSTATGAYEDLMAIADFCEAKGLWFHVDGAHGGAAALSPKYRHLVKGIERADSIIVDFHKMMMMPALATGVFFKRTDDSFHIFQQKAQYLWENQYAHDWQNSGKRTFECTKYMMSLKIYTVLKTYGADIFEENVTKLYDLGQIFAEKVRQHPDFELATWPDCNIVCFRFIAGLAPEAYDAANAQLRQKMLADGRFHIVQTSLHEAVYLRVSLMNPFTTEADLDELLAVLVAKAQ